jgi:hypothetical protein
MSFLTTTRKVNEMKMTNIELVEFLQEREREINDVISTLQSVRDKLNASRAKSQAESEESRIRLNTLRAKAGLPVKPRPVITLNNITEGE